ncbi:hypothetical protein I9W82_005310 [Candida metapsilosis]|uniref:Uncharacterized protein n=1 Tax=Candida metapsilosis TaxID=273372 RepID=A0A8H7ZCF8_9ASCO|nr:hypothetical protein I9W82_005310 [Candida metapsilosis]
MPNTTDSTRMGHRHRVRHAPVIIKNYGPVYNAPTYHFSFPIGNLTNSPFIANDAVYDPASNTTTFTSKDGSNSSDNLVAKVILNGNFTTETPSFEAAESDQSSSPTVSSPTVSTPIASETTESVPSVSIPSVSAPTVSIPTESVPSVSVPTVSAPTVSIPTVSVPTVSELPTNTTTVAANPSASPSTIGDVDIIALKASTKNLQTRIYKVLSSHKQPLNYDLVKSHLKQRSERSHNCYSKIEIPSDVKLIMKQQEQSDKDAIHLELPAGAPRGTLKRMLEKVPQPWQIHKVIVHFNDKEFEPFEVRYFNSVYPFTKRVDPTNSVLACVSKKLDNVHFWQALRLRDELRQIHILQKKLATENGGEQNECPTNNEKDLTAFNGVTDYPTIVANVYDSAENQGSVCDDRKDDVKEETQVVVSVIDVDSDPQPIDNTKAEESICDDSREEDVKKETQVVVSAITVDSEPQPIGIGGGKDKEESVTNFNVKEEPVTNLNVKEESAIKPNDNEGSVIVQNDNLPYVHGLSKLLDLREESFDTIFSGMILPLLTSDWQGQLPGDQPPTFVRLEFFLTEKGKINKSYKTRCEKQLATFIRTVHQHLLDMGTSQEAVLKRTLESDLYKRTFSLYFLAIELLQTPEWKKMKKMKQLMASAGKIFNSVSRFLNSLVKEFQLAVDGTEFDEQLVEKLNRMISITESEVQKVLEATIRLEMTDYVLFEKFSMLDRLPPKPETKEVVDKQPDELNSILKQ